MKKYLLMLITSCLLIALSGPMSAMPSVHNYDCSDTTPTASDAQADQSSMGYTSSWTTAAFALTGKVLVSAPYL